MHQHVTGTAPVITLAAIQILKPVANKIGLLDLPNHRKHHQGAIPLIGGVSIFIGVALSCMLLVALTYQQEYLLFGALAIVILGVLDDLYDISVRLRLFVQAICTIYLCYTLGISLSYMGNMFGVSELDIGLLGVIVTVFAVIGGINAYNMMDGIDGLAGSMALVSLLALAVLFSRTGAYEYVQWALMFSAAILPYLLVNLKLIVFRNKIFMGDAGSMLLGFVIVWLLILGTQQETKHIRTVTALWVIAVPLMDMAAIMIRRIRKGHSPFKPDRKHLHHIFLRAGLNARESLGVIFLTALTITGFGVICEIAKVPEYIMFTLFILMFAGYYYSLHRICKIVKWFRHKPYR